MLMFCMRAETRQMSSDFGFIGSCWECHIARGEGCHPCPLIGHCAPVLASDWPRLTHRCRVTRVAAMLAQLTANWQPILFIES